MALGDVIGVGKRNETVNGPFVLASGLTIPTGNTTIGWVSSRGAKAVHYYLKSSADTDTFSAIIASTRVKPGDTEVVGASQGTSISVTFSAIAANLGILATLTPQAGGGTRFAADQVGLRVTPNAQIDDVTVSCWIEY